MTEAWTADFRWFFFFLMHVFNTINFSLSIVFAAACKKIFLFSFSWKSFEIAPLTQMLYKLLSFPVRVFGGLPAVFLLLTSNLSFTVVWEQTSHGFQAPTFAEVYFMVPHWLNMVNVSHEKKRRSPSLFLDKAVSRSQLPSVS